MESLPAVMSSGSSSDENNTLYVPHRWSSDGSGTFTIEDAMDSDVKTTGRGTRIVMKLKEKCKEFAEEDKIKNIIKRYSNFVAFPIKLNGSWCPLHTYEITCPNLLLLSHSSPK